LRRVKLEEVEAQYAGIEFLPLSPAWAMVEDRLLVSPTLNGLRLALKQLRAGSDVTSAPAFKELLERTTGAPLNLQALPACLACSNPDPSQPALAIPPQLLQLFADAARSDLREGGVLHDLAPQLSLSLLDKLDFALFPSNDMFQPFLKPSCASAFRTAKGVVFRHELAAPNCAALFSALIGWAAPGSAALAVPEVLQARLHNHETAAYDACLTFVDAQHLYHERDWDGDGIKEYAQSLHGGRPIAAVEVPKPPEATPENQAALAPLLVRLSVDDFETRKRAAETVRRLGPAAILPLESAAKETKDAELRARCEELAGELRAALLATVPPDTRFGLYLALDRRPAGLIETPMALAEGPPSQKPKAMAGYCFKVLTAQGPDAEGGRKNYFSNPREPDPSKRQLTEGFALLAYPARYLGSGKHCLIVNQEGTVYKKDLGPETPRLAEEMREFNPDKSWKIADPLLDEIEEDLPPELPPPGRKLRAVARDPAEFSRLSQPVTDGTGPKP
jgi:hypothetical protein